MSDENKVRLPSILIGNRTGGQGKTLISQLIHYGYSLAGQSLTLVAADSSDAAGQDQQSKLGRFLPNVVELGIGAKMDDVRDDSRVMVAYWDRIGPHLRGGSTLVDLGANILPLIFDWAVQRKAHRVLQQSEIDLVVPVTAQRQSMMDGLESIRTSLAAEAQIPFKNRFVVFNHLHGPFDHLSNTEEMKAFRSLQSERQITRVDLPRCTTDIWEQVEAEFFSLQRLADMTFQEYGAQFDLAEFPASGAQDDVISWLKIVMDNFREAGLIPKEAPDAALQPAA